jgi:hypothetical protein
VHRPAAAAVGAVAAVRGCTFSRRVGDDHGAQRQRHVHAAGEGDVADATAVRPPLHRLQLVDDLHRPHLRTGTQVFSPILVPSDLLNIATPLLVEQRGKRKAEVPAQTARLNTALAFRRDWISGAPGLSWLIMLAILLGAG